jgi:signal transduction histidine kinase
MSREDDTPPDLSADPFAQLRHDLKSPLTTIHGRSQLLARGIRRSSSLPEEERERLLASTLAIEAAVLALVALIDGIGGGDAEDGTAAG